MELEDRTYLEKRVGELRVEILALGKFGRSTEYYLEHLDNLVRIARRTGLRLALPNPERLFDAESNSMGNPKNKRNPTLDSRDKGKRRTSAKKSVGK